MNVLKLFLSFGHRNRLDQCAAAILGWEPALELVCWFVDEMKELGLNIIMPEF